MRILSKIKNDRPDNYFVYEVFDKYNGVSFILDENKNYMLSYL